MGTRRAGTEQNNDGFTQEQAERERRWGDHRRHRGEWRRRCAASCLRAHTLFCCSCSFIVAASILTHRPTSAGKRIPPKQTLFCLTASTLFRRPICLAALPFASPPLLAHPDSPGYTTCKLLCGADEVKKIIVTCRTQAKADTLIAKLVADTGKPASFFGFVLLCHCRIRTQHQHPTQYGRMRKG